MEFFNEQKVSLITLNDLLKSNFQDSSILYAIQNNTFDESTFFYEKNLIDMPLIVRLANHHSFFETLCKKEQYIPLWENLYSQLGLLLVSSGPKRVALYTHKNTDAFDLLRGTYFFYCSQQVRKALANNFTAAEMHFLEQAKQYQSVHAIQRYNQFLFEKAASDEEDNGKVVLTEAIQNCKGLLELYGSYAYMMLAEAYYQYALWALNQANEPSYRGALNAAILSCRNADHYLVDSEFSIHNASLGMGLSCSNSFGEDCPNKAIERLEDLLENHRTDTPLASVRL